MHGRIGVRKIIQLVKAFIAAHSRLHAFYFPAYALELNPVEGVWTQAKEATAGTTPHHVQALHCNLYAALTLTFNSPRRLQACRRLSKLPPIKSFKWQAATLLVHRSINLALGIQKCEGCHGLLGRHWGRWHWPGVASCAAGSPD